MRRRAGRGFVLLAVASAMLLAAAPPGSLSDRIEEYTRRVEAIRGRTFRHPVPWSAIDGDEMDRLLRAKLAESVPVPLPEYFRCLASIGAIDASDLPGLTQRVLAFYRSQVLAFYDPDTGKFFVARDALDRLGGGTDAEASLVFTHELTHALQDQYMDLAPRMKALADNGDAALALDCLLEGEATEVMIADAVRGLPLASQDLEDAMAPLLTAGAEDLGPSASRVPRFFRDELLFPYTAGMAFVRNARKKGGWKEVDRLWRIPPSSTSEILHGTIAFAPSDDLLPSHPSPPAGGALLYTDTLGEWTLRFLFRRANLSDADARASLWRGDRFAFFRAGSLVAYAGVIAAPDPAGARSLAEAWKALHPAARSATRGARLVVWEGMDAPPF